MAVALHYRDGPCVWRGKICCISVAPCLRGRREQREGEEKGMSTPCTVVDGKHCRGSGSGGSGGVLTADRQAAAQRLNSRSSSNGRL